MDAASLTFGELLRRHRVAAGLSQEALAERAGLSARGVSDLERGVHPAPRRETIALLADALGLAGPERAALAGAVRRWRAPLARPAGNLPAALTSFVGRERDMAAVRALLATARLVTLTGAGGCGKTRLALQVAADLAGECPDGVWLVELAALADPALVPQTVAVALGLRAQPGQPILGALIAALRPRRLLLALDNCEHLLDACAHLAEALLRGCPDIRILATSRELLGAAGEAVWRVPSLAAPDPRHPPPPAQILEYEAVRLFVERARLVHPAFAGTAGNALALARLCHRLDGLPLALELAAARASALTAEQLAARLDDRFRLLTGGRRTAPPRHQTLRAAIDWSHDLLTDAERVVLRRLSVFAGGWTLEAAEAVCAGAAVEERAVLDLLMRLVDKSLVVAEEHADAARHRLLETVRQYAAERLEAAGEAAATRARHRDYFLALAERAMPALWTRDQLGWLDRLEAEHDNLRAALAWSHADDHSAEAEVRLVGALGQFWVWRGYNAEGRQRLADALARSAGVAPAARAPALIWAGWLDALHGDVDRARAQLVAGLALARAVGDHRLTAQALWQLASLASLAGDEADAPALLAEALALARQAGAQRETAMVSHILARHLRRRGDGGAARRLLDEGLAASRAAGDRTTLAFILEQLGQLAIEAGDYGRARDLLDEALAQVRSIDFKHAISQGQGSLGDLALAQRDLVAARARYRDSLVAGRDWAGRYAVSQALIRLAELSVARGQHRRAARLFGAGEDAQRVYFYLRQRYEEGVAAARAALGEAAFAAAWAAGQALTPEEAVAEALAEEGGDG